MDGLIIIKMPTGFLLLQLQPSSGLLLSVLEFNPFGEALFLGHICFMLVPKACLFLPSATEESPEEESRWPSVFESSL